MSLPTTVHPLGRRARVLLSSVFGPYAQDDEYGSRKLNPMELWHNQVTRVQGAFSFRMFHPSFGLLMMQDNIDAPCTVLDFPDLDRFEEELKSTPYDIVGISAILANVGKVKKMCEVVRRHRPGATIVVGGHIANLDDLAERVDLDHVAKGEGVRWMRTFLGQDPEEPVTHPAVISAFGFHTMGMDLSKDETAAILIPSVGCPMGCNFCSTSALFGGKGKFVNFFDTGDELFTAICGIEEKLDVRSFFVLDENFLFHKKRALRLLELMKEHDKSWTFMVFSSARVLESYSMEQIVALGVSWIWLGLEGEGGPYEKLKGVDTKALVKRFQSHGVRVLGSTIIGLETHRPENMDSIIDYAVSHETDFHQFMLYMPLPGTPLYQEHTEKGTLLSPEEFPFAEIHGQSRFNYRHDHLPTGTETDYLLKAFETDFRVNGPSTARMIRTTLLGWQRHKNHPDPRVRDRFEWEIKPVRYLHMASLWAIRKWYRADEHIKPVLDALYKDLAREFGWKSRLASQLIGRYIYFHLRREVRRLKEGLTYEPRTSLTLNEKAMALAQGVQVEAAPPPVVAEKNPVPATLP